MKFKNILIYLFVVCQFGFVTLLNAAKQYPELHFTYYTNPTYYETQQIPDFSNDGRPTYVSFSPTYERNWREYSDSQLLRFGYIKPRDIKLLNKGGFGELYFKRPDGSPVRVDLTSFVQDDYGRIPSFISHLPKNIADSLMYHGISSDMLSKLKFKYIGLSTDGKKRIYRSDTSVEGYDHKKHGGIDWGKVLHIIGVKSGTKPKQFFIDLYMENDISGPQTYTVTDIHGVTQKITEKIWTDIGIVRIDTNDTGALNRVIRLIQDSSSVDGGSGGGSGGSTTSTNASQQIDGVVNAAGSKGETPQVVIPNLQQGSGSGVVGGSGDDAQEKSEDMQRLIRAGIPEDIAHWVAYEPAEFERICQRPQQQAQLDQENKAREKQSLISAGIPEDIADFVVNDPEGFERLRQESLGRRSGETHDLRPDISSAAPQPSVEKSAPQKPTLGERVREFFSRTTTVVTERSKEAARDFSFGAARTVATSGTDHLLRYLFASPPPMDGAHFFGKGPEETRYTPYLDRPLLNLRTTLPPDVEMREIPQDPESAACSAGAPTLPIIFDDTARPLKIKKSGDFSSNPTVVDKPFVIPHSVVGMEEPAATTQQGSVAPSRLKKFTERTTKYNDALARLTGDDSTLQNTCKFVSALNKFAELYADAEDGESAEALARAGRHMVRCGQRAAAALGQGAVRGVRNFDPKAVFVANAKLAMFAISEMARLEALDQVTFAPAEVRDQVTAEYYQHISEQNKAMAEAAKQTLERLKSMTWEEILENIAELGVDLLAQGAFFHGLGKMSGAALKTASEISTNFREMAKAERIAIASGCAPGPITELGQQVAVVGKVAATEGPEVAGKVIEIIKDNPALLAEGKPVAQVVQEVAKDVKSIVSTRDVSTIIDSAIIPKRGGETVVGHALQKHAGRHPEIWNRVRGNAGMINDMALKHLQEIIDAPGQFVKATNPVGIEFLEKRLADGRGVRLNLDKTFKGFID